MSPFHGAGIYHAPHLLPHHRDCTTRVTARSGVTSRPRSPQYKYSQSTTANPHVSAALSCNRVCLIVSLSRTHTHHAQICNGQDMSSLLKLIKEDYRRRQLTAAEVRLEDILTDIETNPVKFTVASSLTDDRQWLHFVAQQGAPRPLRRLIECGADIHARDAVGAPLPPMRCRRCVCLREEACVACVLCLGVRHPAHGKLVWASLCSGCAHSPRRLHPVSWLCARLSRVRGLLVAIKSFVWRGVVRCSREKGCLWRFC